MQESFNDKKVFNIAADAEVNQYIDVLPKDAIDIKNIDPMLPPKAGTKYYYEYLYKVHIKLFSQLHDYRSLSNS
jgi:predicted metal-dependent peptidase